MSEAKIQVYKGPAGGWGALKSVARHLNEQGVPVKGAKTLLHANQTDGFDCPGCAWPDRNPHSTFEFCENGVKAVANEATSRRIGAAFFAEHPVSWLAEQDDAFLEAQGRLTEPLVYDPATDHLPAGARFETLAIHGGQHPEPITGAVMPPIFQTSTYAQKGPGEHSGFEYSRTRGTIFTSAYTKVYAGYGPGGIGAIYAVDPAGGGATVFATIPNAGSLPARAGYAPNPNSVSGDWLQVETKNRFAVGDTLEVVHPSGNLTLRLNEMRNAQGRPVDVAQGSPVRVWVPLPARYEGALLARVVVEALA